jgi:exportin-1
VTLKCLTEIAQLKNINGQYKKKIEQLFVLVMQYLLQTLPLQLDLRAAYDSANEEDQNFLQNLAIFFSSLFINHRLELEQDAYTKNLFDAHQYLTHISLIDDRELFKICMDYWCSFARDLYHEVPIPQGNAITMEPSVVTPRRQLYAGILTRVRRIVISKMAKPEEIIIVEDDNGQIIRERVPDGEAMALYKLMKETLVFLTHLDYDDTQTIMLEKLAAQMDGSEWSWYNLNTLCWAIGSIAGAHSESRERRFLVTVLKDLLGLCENKKGKDNKAVVASNIMYIVGQYPRFLRAHYKFLTTVVNKLFEFMHETHPGVQDMSCDTFLKISKSCAEKFAVVQPGESHSFTVYVLQNIAQFIADLSEQQIHTFYEAVGHMIHAHEIRDMEPLIAVLMDLPNQTWRDIMGQVKK